MFKSKLQEVCQKKAWALPEYSSTKEGLDHDPRFSASVHVNGLTFHTAQSFRSSKFAQNDAARLAFEHFSAPAAAPLPVSRPAPSAFPQPSLLSGVPTGSQVSDNTTVVGSQNNGSTLSVDSHKYSKGVPTGSQVSDNTTVVGSQNNGSTLSVDSHKYSEDVQHLHKNQLQYYAQKRNLTLPVYSCEREGPPHAARFKCKVTIDGQTYQGQEFVPTVKDAEHAAAKVALISMLPNGVQEDDTGLYKNLLQELLHKEGQNAPLYSTTTLGEPHMRRFVSTVEIEGEYFKGEVARSKKLAEVSAAKVAYNTLRDRKSSNIPLFLTPAMEGQDRSELISSKAPSVVAVDLQQQMRPNTPIPNSVKRETELEISVATVETSGLGTTPSSGVINVTVGGGSTSSGTVHARQPKTSRPASQNGLFSTLASDCTSDVDSTLEPPAKRFFSNKVSVYPRTAATLPEDSVVLPLSDENWVAVSPMNQECRINH